PLHVGSGAVEMAHGRFPVPPPAVVELLRDAPIYSTEIQGELVTPTGAAIISTLCESFGPMPPMRVSSVGYGAGAREYERFPNALRVIVGESDAGAGDERLLVVETNLDDVSPQIVGHLMERAFERGALDCYFTPVQMKKNRPGVLVSILCRPQDRDQINQLLFNETTTLGVRSQEVLRRALPRESVLVETQYGAIRVKVARHEGRVVNATPEYDDCRAAARNFNAPLRDVESAARAAFLKIETGEKR
ncbi:MAG: LarC family nickel insertion protein, partial [Acidobacteriota bacterium]|nr:LarC family nickel insertion protein [Acidobacteriota bacterium]